MNKSAHDDVASRRAGKELRRRRYIAYGELADKKVGKGYFVMIGLAAVIAAFGLLLNSSAVIIGAMLVAPLMTPILVVALGIARGDVKAIRHKMLDIAFGALVAILVATLVSFARSDARLTVEMVARTAPNLYDLAVAVFSGIAGAYAFADEDLSASLPGVAIAAALVPPLAVIGLGLGSLDFSVVIGASVLFMANLIAIILSASVTFIAIGYFSYTAKSQAERRLKALIVSAVALVLVAIPMTYFMVQNIVETTTKNKIDNIIEENFPVAKGFRTLETEWTRSNGNKKVIITFTGISPPDDERVNTLIEDIGNVTDKDTKTEVRFVPYYSFEDGHWK